MSESDAAIMFNSESFSNRSSLIATPLPSPIVLLSNFKTVASFNFEFEFESTFTYSLDGFLLLFEIGFLSSDIESLK